MTSDKKTCNECPWKEFDPISTLYVCGNSTRPFHVVKLSKAECAKRRTFRKMKDACRLARHNLKYLVAKYAENEDEYLATIKSLRTEIQAVKESEAVAQGRVEELEGAMRTITNGIVATDKRTIEMIHGWFTGIAKAALEGK